MRIYRRLTLSFSEIDKLLSRSKQTCACAGISVLKLIAGEFKTPIPRFGRWFTNVIRVTQRWSRWFKLINLMFLVDSKAWWCSSIKKTQKRGVKSCEDASRTWIVFSGSRLKAATVFISGLHLHQLLATIPFPISQRYRRTAWINHWLLEYFIRNPSIRVNTRLVSSSSSNVCIIY